MKNWLVYFTLLSGMQVNGQTLFYYGRDSVTVHEFSSAYQHSNKGANKNISDYLMVFIASRLKVKEAELRGYDTLPQIKSELENLRQQILPSYLVSKETMSRLIREAYLRSLKELHIRHIFISFYQSGIYDTIQAIRRMREVKQTLTGTNFTQVAAKWSDDPAAKVNKGDLGFISVFALPYELENIVYTLPPGKISQPFRSKAGFHIFQNVEERAITGRPTVAQILLALPPAFAASDLKTMSKRADSIYKVLVNGASFEQLAKTFSNDMSSLSHGGAIGEVAPGIYDPVFEKTAYGLLKDGAISKPIQTSFGFHILKRIRKEPIIDPELNAKAREKWQAQIQESNRIQLLREGIAQDLLRQGTAKKAAFSFDELWLFSDSLINYKRANKDLHISLNTSLLDINGVEVRASDWIQFAETYRYKADGSGTKPYPVLWEEFVQSQVLHYYEDHLEHFNNRLREQLKEFREGSLFFEIMQREVWNLAQSDSAGLYTYFLQHRKEYQWKKTVGALVFYSPTFPVIRKARKAMQHSSYPWTELTNIFKDKLVADSGRFECAQLGIGTKLSAGTVTAIRITHPEKTYSFSVILRNYSRPELKSYEEARSLVLTDYQNFLDQQWILQLKQKYPVKINEAVWRKCKAALQSHS